MLGVSSSSSESVVDVDGESEEASWLDAFGAGDDGVAWSLVGLSPPVEGVADCVFGADDGRSVCVVCDAVDAVVGCPDVLD